MRTDGKMAALVTQTNLQDGRNGVASLLMRHRWTFALALPISGLFAMLYLVDPSQSSWYPSCLFHQLTGWHCAGCGATRAIHELLHGHLFAAWRQNALLILGLPFFAYFVWKTWRHQAIDLPRWLTWFLLAFLLAFSIVRNIPVYPFTVLAPG